MLPQLREEISLYQGPSASNGSPTWVIQDASRNLFFRIDWLTYEILSRWHLDDIEKIVASVDQDTPLEIDEDEVKGVVQFLDEHELLNRHSANDSKRFAEKIKHQQSTSWWKWLLHRYLFFRVPLWRPDQWLSKTSWLVSPFYSRYFYYLSFIALALGLVQISQQWQTFVATLVDTYSWQGLFGYLVTIVIVKFFHELGHAYTAKRYGCKVPTMGIAFLVFFPMAYTDVNEAWKLKRNQQRLAVGAAGIATELIIAVWATLAWAMLPDGFLRTIAFLLATTTWISTLVINASPFLRFDGYFLLMDWLDLPNLHQRTFSLSKWHLRELLFGLREDMPEHFSKSREKYLVVFGYLIWVYRLIVFGGIALLLFHSVAKPLGPGLAGVEIFYFIAMPIWGELKAWQDRLPKIMRSSRSVKTALVLLTIISCFLLPWDARVSSQAILRPIQQFPIVSPGPSIVDEIAVANKSKIISGTVLIKLASPDLEFQKNTVAAKEQGLSWQAGTVGVDAKTRQQKQVIAAARSKVGAEVSGIKSEQERYKIKAPFDGVFFLENPDLQPGVWLGKNEKIGVLANTASWQVETYLPESSLNRVAVGDKGRFYSEAPDEATIDLKVTHIDKDATHFLTDKMLASTHGGELIVREKGKNIVPEKALYHITLTPVEPLETQQQILRGKVVIQGKPQAWLDEYIRSASAFWVREASF